MAARTDRPKHPAKKFYTLAVLCILLTILFGFITVFVPWSWKDIAPGQRIWAYPFKNCIEDTFSAMNAESCVDNDYTSATSVSGGNTTCRTWIVTTIAFVFITVIIGLLFLPLLLLVLKKLWSRPIALAILAQIYLTIIMVAAFLQWGLWIGYAETTCANSVLFPLRGYSYGFIINVFGSFFALVAWLLGYLGLIKIATWKPFKGAEFGDASLPYGMAAPPMSPGAAPSPYGPAGLPPSSPAMAYPPAGVPLPYNLYQ